MSATTWGNTFRSTLGMKYLMALTGVALLGFAFVHMLGNLQVFALIGHPDAHPLTNYAVLLRKLGNGLWLFRAVLFACVVVHFWTALQLRARNQAARPVKYAMEATQVASLSSRTMILSGLVVAAFILYHLAHFTFRMTGEFGAIGEVTLQDGTKFFNVDMMVVEGFKKPAITGFYIVAQVLLAMHLWHAASSWFQTLGLRLKGYQGLSDKLGPALATLIVIGNCSIPAAILTGIVHL